MCKVTSHQHVQGNIALMYILYSTLLYLPPLRFHCVGGCWDEAQDCGDFGSGTWAVTVRHSNQSAIDLIKHSARSHPHPAKSHPHSAPDCIYTQLQISSAIRLGLIHNLARSHPQFGQILSTIRHDLIYNSARS